MSVNLEDLANSQRRKFLRPDHQHTGARVYKSTDFSHNSSGNWLPITYDTVRWDEQRYWVSTANSRFTIEVPGIYAISGHLIFASNSTGIRGISILLNGSTFIAGHWQTAINGTTTAMSISTIYKLVNGDYVEMQGYQNSTGTLAISAIGNDSPEFAIQRLAPYV